jgi:hypothetical protein
LKNIIESGFENMIEISWYKGINRYYKYVYYKNNDLNSPLGSNPIDLWIRVPEDYGWYFSDSLQWLTIGNNLKIKIIKINNYT